MVEISAGEVAEMCLLYDRKKNKSHFGTLRQNPWHDFPQIFVVVHTLAVHVYSRFHQDPFTFVGVITKKPLYYLQSECEIGPSSL